MTALHSIFVSDTEDEAKTAFLFTVSQLREKLDVFEPFTLACIFSSLFLFQGTVMIRPVPTIFNNDTWLSLLPVKHNPIPV